MTELNLKALMEKLNPLCKSQLEAAIGICLERQQYNVELEHFLLALLQQESSAFCQLLKYLSIDIDLLNQDLHKSISKLPAGNDQTPALSPRIIDLINEAWLCASLELDAENIHSGIMLYALMKNTIFKQLCSGISNVFKPLTAEQVLEHLENAFLDSSEIAVNPNEQVQQTKQEALSQFAINLTAQAKAGKIDAAIGRDDEVRQMIDILSRRRQNNAILTGEPGVGKTAIVEGLALRVVNKDVPDHLKNVQIYALDIGLLQAGAGVKGEFEKRLKQLIDEVKQSPEPIILFIDEAHTLIGAGGQSGQNDAANLLKPALARGELRSIAATTWAEYKQYFEKDAALTRRFQVVKVEEPNIDVAIQMLRSLVPNLEKHHHVKILESAVSAATALSARYITGRQLPDKSISILDTACARVASKQTTLPAVIDNAQKALQQLEQETARLSQESDYGFNHIATLKKLNAEIKAKKAIVKKYTERFEKEKALVNELLETYQAIAKPELENKKVLQQSIKRIEKQLTAVQGDEPMIQPYVDEQVIAEVIADWTGIPVGRMIKDDIKNILSLSDALKARVIGQDHALERVAKTLRSASAKLTDPNKPSGVFLFVGPSGVGKTETAHALAEQVFGHEQNMTVINMSEFKEAHKVSMLAGSPPGYVGYGEGGVLTEAVRRKPYSLILLDEMEKANPAVQDVFYQVFDKGMMKDGQGRDIDFKNTLIVLTSNACSDLITQLALSDGHDLSADEIVEAIQSELEKTFKPAFLGRVTIIPYLPLNESSLKQIIELKLGQVKKRMLKSHQLIVNFSENLINWVYQQCHHHSIGARQVDNILTKTILPQLSSLYLEQVLSGKKLKSMQVDIEENGELLCQFESAVKRKKAA